MYSSRSGGIMQVCMALCMMLSHVTMNIQIKKVVTIFVNY